MPLRACIERGCPNYAVDGGSRCAEHHRAFENQRWDQGATGRRGSRAGWRELRKRVFRRQHGRCGVCGKRLAQFALHHVDENARNDQESNLVALCPRCHEHYHRL